MSKYVYIKTANDSAYMNTAANFRGATHTSDTGVDLFFKAAAVGGDGASAGFDKISLVITTEKEQEVMTAIGGALAGTHSKGMIVIADDVASSYVNAGITSVGAITLSATGTFKTLKTWNADLALEASDSGAWVYASDATALDLRLPAASGNAGVNYQIFIQKAQTGDTHILAEAGDFFEGALLISDADTATENLFFAVANTAEDDVINLDSDAKGRLAGGFIELVCDGTKWHVQGRLNGTGTLATPFHTAES